jgi:hypothetical protein
MTTFLPSDIYLIRYDSLGGSAAGHAAAIVLLENGWALDISQSDTSTPSTPIKDIPLSEAKFTCQTLRPWPNEPGAKPKILGASSRHGLQSFNDSYLHSGISLQEVAKTLTALSKLPSTSEFTTKEILDANRRNSAPYNPSQIDQTPICRGSGAELESDFLKDQTCKGILREPFDYKSPVKFPFYKDNEIEMRMGTDVNGADTFQYVTMLLPTGHAFYAEEIADGNGSETRFEITPLTPDNQSILQKAEPLDLDDLFEGFEHAKPESPYLTKNQITDLANAFIRQRSILPPKRLKEIVAINAQNQNAEFPITQFNRLQMNENTGTPLDITLIEPGPAPSDRHP